MFLVFMFLLCLYIKIRKGGKVAKEEKWFYKDQSIKISSEFSYLGVLLATKMPFTKHVEKRNLSSKNSICTTWNNFLAKKYISLKSKWKLFLAVARSTQAYGSQVWGSSYFQEVDKLQLYFMKKVLKLPNFIPTYIIMLETAAESGHIFTLDLHLRYVLETLFVYKEKRLPHILSKKLLQYQLAWFKDLNALGNEHGIQWTLENLSSDDWNRKRKLLLDAIKSKEVEGWKYSGENTNRYYRNLDWNVGRLYMVEGIAQNKIL